MAELAFDAPAQLGEIGEFIERHVLGCSGEPAFPGPGSRAAIRSEAILPAPARGVRDQDEASVAPRPSGER
jgi:hypothetical protein